MAGATAGTMAPLVRAEDITVRFESRDATVHAVNEVSFTLDPGEVLCILGESGSGKSVTLTRPDAAPARPTRTALGSHRESAGTTCWR